MKITKNAKIIQLSISNKDEFLEAIEILKSIGFSCPHEWGNVPKMIYVDVNKKMYRSTGVIEIIYGTYDVRTGLSDFKLWAKSITNDKNI